MIRHVVSFQLSIEDAAERAEQLAELRRRFEALPAQIPEMLRSEFGVDTGVFEGNWHFALVIDFADHAAVDAYQTHPAHREFGAYLAPIRAARSAVDFEV